MEQKSKEQIVDRQLHIYNMYSDRLKEIIAFLEIEFRGHPLPVLNDIRGLHELMAACFTEAYEPYRETLNCLVSMDNLFDDHLRRINHAVWTGIVVRVAVAIVAIGFLAALIVKYFG